MKKKGQARGEYFIFIGVMLGFLIPLVYFSSGGKRQKLKVTIPRGATNLTILQNNTIQLELLIYGNKTEIFKTTKAVNIRGNLPTNPGTYFLIIESLDNGEVSVDVKE